MPKIGGTIEYLLHDEVSESTTGGQQMGGKNARSQSLSTFLFRVTELNMAAVASDGEQVADLANADISAEEKHADEKPVEEETKEEGGMCD